MKKDFIASDFLKIMDEIEYARSNMYLPPANRQKKMARNISGKVSRFIMWIQNDCEFWYEMNKHYWEEPESNKKYTISELYNYWKLNIDKK